MPATQDLHVHTHFSDGNNSVEAVAQRAAIVGLEAVALTDHFWPSLGAREGGQDVILERRQLIEEARSQWPTVTLLDGVEVDVDLNGEIASVAGGLEQFDLVIFSIHHSCTSQVWASAVDRALRKYSPNILGHWSAMLTSYRAEDGERVAGILADHGVAIELNLRYGIGNRDFLERARDLGCSFSLGSDSHSIETIGRLKDYMQIAQAMGLPLIDGKSLRRVGH